MRWLLPLALAMFGCSSSSSSPSSSGSSGSPTLRVDVMPILTHNCSLAACHGSSASNLNIYLSFDPEQVHTELMKTSPTAQTKFVVAGDAKGSYVQMKLDGTQGTLSSKCGACGAQMPLDLPPLPQTQRDIVRAWINAGAKDD